MLTTNRLHILAFALFAFAILGVELKRSTFVEETSSTESDEVERDEKFIANKNQRPLNQILSETPLKEAESLTGQELVDYVNRNQNLWRAELNDRFLRYNEDTKYGLMGVNHVENSIEGKKNLGKSRYLDIDLPETFDARQKWPQCQSLFAIRDQSSCGSCWAFGAVEAMSDRICIASGGSIQVSLSADDLLSCCHLYPLAAWKYWVRSGIVTGSNFTAGEGCKPYPFAPCEHHSNRTHYEPCPHKLYPTPKCEKKCQSSYNEKSYNEDKFYGKKAYSVERKVQSIQNELFTNGPMEIAFEVYEDFLNYKGGIYKHTGGKLGGGHAVKLIGWGEENGVPYWTVANSWNTDWGEDGFFRILRGHNECGIESGVVAGIPDLKRNFILIFKHIFLGQEDDFEGSYHRQRRHFVHEHNLHL